MADLTLAEIVQEGERLLDREHYHTDVELSGYFYQHGPALLAVARAAVEMRSFIAHDTSDMDPGDTLGWNRMIDAFDAAVRPAKGGPDV
jgi:hypothetical protein